MHLSEFLQVSICQIDVCICPKSAFLQKGVCRGLLGEASCSPLGPLRHLSGEYIVILRFCSFLGEMSVSKLQNSDKSILQIRTNA